MLQIRELKKGKHVTSPEFLHHLQAVDAPPVFDSQRKLGNTI